MLINKRTCAYWIQDNTSKRNDCCSDISTSLGRRLEVVLLTPTIVVTEDVVVLLIRCETRDGKKMSTLSCRGGHTHNHTHLHTHTHTHTCNITILQTSDVCTFRNSLSPWGGGLLTSPTGRYVAVQGFSSPNQLLDFHTCHWHCTCWY